jgi:Tol biopolymer transport system component
MSRDNMKKSHTKLFWCTSLVWALASTTLGLADSVVQAVSLANPSIPAVSGGNSHSAGSVISADGPFVLFLSSATDLVTNDVSGRFLDVFLRNRTNNSTTLVSVNRTGADGGNGHSVSPVVSADGRYVAFESQADPSGPDMTPDGRFIAYSESTGPSGIYSAIYL